MKDLKQCLQCGNYKRHDLYYKATNTDDGLNRYCKQCCKVNRALESVRKRDKSSKVSRRQEHRAVTLGLEEIEFGVTLAMVFKRDLGICRLCREWVQPRYASLDHIKPLSKGGGHTFENLQLTHLKCNLRKGNRHE